MADKVYNYLKSLCEVRRHEKIYTAMFFPATQTSNMKEKTKEAMVQTTYVCDATRCDFSECISAIQQNEQLMQCGCTETCLMVLDDIERYPHAYVPSMLDGILFSRQNQSLVHMEQRKVTTEQGTETGKTGYLAYDWLMTKN